MAVAGFAGIAILMLVAVTFGWLGKANLQSDCPSRFPGDPCNGTLYFGASVEGGDPAPLESLVGGSLTIFRSYQQATTPASEFAARAAADVAAGRLPLISTKLPGSWAEVAAGVHDAWLIERIEALASVDGPVWLVLHHEPQGDGVPADWVRMQQHARQVIDRHASNIALVGILNGSSFLLPGGEPNAYFMPVGTGVDVMGFDSYNPWSPDNGRSWLSAATVFSPGTSIQSWGYPVLVGEYGVHEDPQRPNRAARWLADAYEFGIDHDFLALSYFDSAANSADGSWVLDGETLHQFAANLHRTETASLLSGPVTGAGAKGRRGTNGRGVTGGVISAPLGDALFTARQVAPLSRSDNPHSVHKATSAG